ncbi:MAG: hypothetical protein OHK0039_44160 [Bacteroidia bacterium]
MPKQAIADIRKREILETFYEVAKIEGLENTSFAKIARKLEIQPSLIVHYFNNREALIFELIQYNLEQYSRLFAPDPSDHPSLKAYVLHIIDQMFSTTWNDLFDDGVYYNCYALIFRYPEVKAQFRDLHLQLRRNLATTLRRCREAGLLRTDDPATLADHIYNIIDGTYYHIGMLDDPQAQTQHLASSKALACSLLTWV